MQRHKYSIFKTHKYSEKNIATPSFYFIFALLKQQLFNKQFY